MTSDELGRHQTALRGPTTTDGPGRAEENTSAPGTAEWAAALQHQTRLWSRGAPSFPITRIPSYNAFITFYCDVCRQQYRLLPDNINNTQLNAQVKSLDSLLTAAVIIVTKALQLSGYE